MHKLMTKKLYTVTLMVEIPVLAEDDTVACKLADLDTATRGGHYNIAAWFARAMLPNDFDGETMPQYADMMTVDELRSEQYAYDAQADALTDWPMPGETNYEPWNFSR